MNSTWSQPSNIPLHSQQSNPPYSAIHVLAAGYDGTVRSRPRTASASELDSAPRAVASMEEEITELKAATTQSLDRAITVAQAASNVGGRVMDELQEQREQMGHLDADVRDIEAVLNHTGYNIKHGFTWRGALTSFRRKIKPPPLKGETHRDISPVFTDEYKVESLKNEKLSPKKKSQAAGNTSKLAPSHAVKNGDDRFRTASTAGRQATGVLETPGNERGASRPLGNKHVPEKFDEQLDVLDGLLCDLDAKARAINGELKQQSAGIEVLAERIEPAAAETASQASQIKRRFRLRGV